MTLSNNFIISPAHKYSPNYLSLPFKDEYMNVYGSQLLMSAFRDDSLSTLPYHHGSFFFDTLPKDKPVFEFNQLEARYSKNGFVVYDWKKVSTMRSFIDSGRSNYLQRTIFMQAYSIIADSLKIRDSVLIEFRHATDKPFLRIHANRKDGYDKPHMIGSMQDTSRTEQEFLTNKVFFPENFFDNSEFYYDWPLPGLVLNNQQYASNTRLAFYFRSDPTRDDSTLLFRLKSSRSSDTSWRKIKNVIAIPSLRENTRYRLEVKFANGRGKTSVYTFYTPAEWYQTTAFKVAMAIVALLLILGIGLLLRAQRRKTLRRLHELEIQSLYAQMNPHFLFNALGSIQGLMNDNRIDQANLYLTEFAALLRASISQKKELVPLSTDIKNTERYIDLERLRFNFRYERSIDDRLINSDLEIPSMLVQPLIENAVKHGISGKGEAGILQYSIRQEKTDLVIIVSDNGRGFDTHSGSSGQGLSLTRERIRLFNRMHKGRTIHLEIESSTGGTRALVRLQNWLV